MDYKIEECILIAIDKRASTKKYVYEGLGMSANGFAEMIKRKSIKVKDLIELSHLLGMKPQEFFEQAEIEGNNANDNKAKYLVQQSTKNGNNHNGIEENRSLKEEVEFLRGQVSSLTKMLENALAK